MLDVAELQRAAGHEVELFGMQHPENPPGLTYADTFPTLVELEPPPQGGRAKVAAAARMLWSRSSEKGLAETIQRFQPDVVHCHNIYHQLSPSILRPVAAAGIPCVMTLHDYKLACPSYQMLDHGNLCNACVTGGPLQAARRRCKDGSFASSALLSLESSLHRLIKAYAPVTTFVCPSQFLATVMREAGVFPDRMAVINHFVVLDGAPLADRPGRGFVFGGRLSREKGVDVLIRAVALSGVTLDIAGDGPVKAELEALAAELAPDRITFHGRLPRDELQALMRGSVASVVPSRWHENQPMTILESLGAGVPVIATALGGMPELVRDGIEGWVVPHDDPAALARTLTAVAADPVTAHAMGLAARERMLREFSSSAHLARLEEVYLRDIQGMTRRPSTTRAGGGEADREEASA